MLQLPFASVVVLRAIPSGPVSVTVALVTSTGVDAGLARPETLPLADENGPARRIAGGLTPPVPTAMVACALPSWWTVRPKVVLAALAPAVVNVQLPGRRLNTT